MGNLKCKYPKKECRRRNNGRCIRTPMDICTFDRSPSEGRKFYTYSDTNFAGGRHR